MQGTALSAELDSLSLSTHNCSLLTNNGASPVLKPVDSRLIPAELDRAKADGETSSSSTVESNKDTANTPWECVNCTFVNDFPDVDACELCDAKKPPYLNPFTGNGAAAVREKQLLASTIPKVELQHQPTLRRVDGTESFVSGIV